MLFERKHHIHNVRTAVYEMLNTKIRVLAEQQQSPHWSAERVVCLFFAYVVFHHLFAVPAMQWQSKNINLFI